MNIKEKLEEIAKKECWSDDEDMNAFEFSGGNYDDAYYAGCDTGEILLARTLLKEYFSE